MKAVLVLYVTVIFVTTNCDSLAASMSDDADGPPGGSPSHSKSAHVNDTNVNVSSHIPNSSALNDSAPLNTSAAMTNLLPSKTGNVTKHVAAHLNETDEISVEKSDDPRNSSSSSASETVSDEPTASDNEPPSDSSSNPGLLEVSVGAEISATTSTHKPVTERQTLKAQESNAMSISIKATMTHSQKSTSSTPNISSLLSSPIVPNKTVAQAQNTSTVSAVTVTVASQTPAANIGASTTIAPTTTTAALSIPKQNNSIVTDTSSDSATETDIDEANGTELGDYDGDKGESQVSDEEEDDIETKLDGDGDGDYELSLVGKPDEGSNPRESETKPKKPSRGKKPKTAVSKESSVEDSSDSQSSGTFFFNILVVIVLVALIYVAYHNRQKLKAWMIEGRMKINLRRAKQGDYSKLSTKADDILPSAADTRQAKNYIY